jgi:hypothetical protein
MYSTKSIVKQTAKQCCRRSMTTNEVITADSAIAALYSQLPRGEVWDRQPEDLRLMNGSDKESIVRYLYRCIIFFIFQFCFCSSFDFLLLFSCRDFLSNHVVVQIG